MNQSIYTPENQHDIGKSPRSIGNTSSNGGFSLVMWVFRRVHFNKTTIQQTEPSSHTSRLVHRSPLFRVPMTHKPNQQHWGTPVTHSIAILKPFLAVRHLRRRKPWASFAQAIHFSSAKDRRKPRKPRAKGSRGGACLLALGLSADWFLLKFSGRRSSMLMMRSWFVVVTQIVSIQKWWCVDFSDRSNSMQHTYNPHPHHLHPHHLHPDPQWPTYLPSFWSCRRLASQKANLQSFRDSKHPKNFNKCTPWNWQFTPEK